MRIDEVDKIFGKLLQTPQNLPNGNKINNKLLITERATSGMSDQIKYFLEYCSRPENFVLFSEKSSEGYVKYRKMIKLFLVDSNVLALTMMSEENVDQLLDQNKEICGLE